MPNNQTGLRSTRQRWAASLGVIALAALAIAGIWFSFALRDIAGRVQAKAGAAHMSARPARCGGVLQAEVQTEPHTCGLHALRSLYRSYGLNPDEKNLRLRLGVDRNVALGLPETTGTLHPDLFRVLRDDGFGWQLLAVDDEGAANALTQHLRRPQHALVLIARPATGGLHWVVATAGAMDEVRIYDSLEPEPAHHPVRAFLNEQALSVILIDPKMSKRNDRVHEEGLAEMARVAQRGP